MTTDRVLSICSVIIALTAVCISIWQGIAVREHNRLSFKPYITSAPHLPGTHGDNGVFISNAGTGPAFIKSAYIRANGKEFDITVNNWPSIFTHLNLKRSCYANRWFKEGATLKAGQEMKIIAPTTSILDASCLEEFLKLISSPELTLSMEYESIYGEEFRYSQRIGLDAQEAARLKQEVGY